MTTAERTNWRDNTLSARHRTYGYDCPATDLDFPMLEYSRAEPVALIEYKAGLTYVVDLEKATYRAMARLANGSGIPFVVALYHPQRFAFKLLAGNYHARHAITKFAVGIGENTMLSEREYVAWLYGLRRLELPADVAAGLNTWKPTFGGQS